MEYRISYSEQFSDDQVGALRRFEPVITDNAARLLFTTSNFRWEKDREILSGDYACLVKNHSGVRILSFPLKWLISAQESEFLEKLEEYDAYDRSPRIQGFERITVDPRVMAGKPCIRGMRVTVGMIVGMVAVGHSRTRILEMYPYLESQDIDQALRFASWRVDEKEYELVAS
jgi:uncharacterized protein (DUF433 family)